MDIIQEIIKSAGDNVWVQLVLALVTFASAVAAVTPTPKEGSVWSKAYKVIDFLAINVGKAKDKSEPEK